MAAHNNLSSGQFPQPPTTPTVSVGGNPWWMNSRSQNSDPHGATISAALPTGVAAPADTQGYHPVGWLHALIGDYRPHREDD